MKNPSLHERAGYALIVLSLAAAVVGAAACDDNTAKGTGLVTTVSPISASATISPGVIGLTPLGGFGCPGFVFGTSFNVIVVSTGQDLTMDNLTLHMIDGTNLGPSVTFPSSKLNAQFGTTIVRAGTSRVFPLQPVFGCTGTWPQAVTASVVVTDQHGRLQTLDVTAAVQ